MKPVEAELIKLSTKDGMVEMMPHVSLGKKYTVDLNTKRVESGYNTKKKKHWSREIVNEIGGGWLPTEMLKIMADE